MDEEQRLPDGEGEDVKELLEDGPELTEQEALAFEDEEAHPPEEDVPEEDEDEVRDG